MQARYTVAITFNEEEAGRVRKAAGGVVVGRWVKGVVMRELGKRENGGEGGLPVKQAVRERVVRKAVEVVPEVGAGLRINGELVELGDEEAGEPGEPRKVTAEEIAQAVEAQAKVELIKKRQKKWENKYCPGHHVMGCGTCD